MSIINQYARSYTVTTAPSQAAMCSTSDQNILNNIIGCLENTYFYPSNNITYLISCNFENSVENLKFTVKYIRDNRESRTASS